MAQEILDDFQGADILSQGGNCSVRLARYLLTLNVQDRLIPKAELALRYQLGVGTIQASLHKLQDVGAVRLVSRGHLGTFVEELDKNMLWKFSMYGYIRGTMPLPYSNVLAGLATGLRSAFPDEGMMLRMSYMRGSRVRIKNLQAGLDDFTVCSKLAAHRAMEEDGTLTVYLDFGSGTYLGDSVFLMRKGAKLTAGTRLGVDASSYDHETLSRLACQGIDVTFIPVGYNTLFRMIREGKIDGALWSLRDMDGHRFEGDIVTLPHLTDDIRDAGTAVVLTRAQNREKMQAVWPLFDKKAILKHQKDVVDEKEIPNY